MNLLGLTNKWDLRFVEMAQLVSTWSKDPEAQVGAVIVSPTKRQFSLGFNGFVSGARDDYRHMEADEKNRHTVHAELNAILNARSSVEGWTLYATKFPCHECAKAVIQAGVARVVCLEPDNGKWAGTQDEADVELQEAAVEVSIYQYG